MPGNGGFDTVYAVDENKQHWVLTKSDLEALRNGTKIAFVILELSYKDQGEVHHYRTCQFLQPPAIPPGIWHYCDVGFTQSD